MASVVKCFALAGVDAYPVHIETMTTYGQPSLIIIGLGDLAVKEANERIQAAITHEGYEVPKKKIVINLAPSDIKKKGSHFDLAMAIGLLEESDQLKSHCTKHYGFIGEISLNGELRGSNGVLSMVIAARDQGLENLIVPNDNLLEAMLVKGMNVYGFDTLRQVTKFLEGELAYEPKKIMPSPKKLGISRIDFSDVKGQEEVIRYAVVAAAGGHNMLMVGEPGCGKSMIAQRISTILPTMCEMEALEVTKIYSVAGLLQHDKKLIDARPFRTPHHNASMNALIGGGNYATPGEVSLAHHGILFLDELVEFNRKTLESLRQPLEDKMVTISRVNGTNCYPANFMLIAAMNPCPCGYGGTPKCTCTAGQIQRYRQRLSGPMLDRFDVQKWIRPVDLFDDQTQKRSKTSQELRVYVEQARQVQAKRFEHIDDINCNAQMTPGMIKTFCEMESGASKRLKTAYEVCRFSARTLNKMLRVARTFADFDEAAKIREKDIRLVMKARDFED